MGKHLMEIIWEHLLLDVFDNDEENIINRKIPITIV
jgi:hypothetical protein